MAQAYLLENFKASPSISEAVISAVSEIESRLKSLLNSNHFTPQSKRKRIRAKPFTSPEPPRKPVINKENRDKQILEQKEKAAQNKNFISQVQQKHTEIRKREQERQQALSARLLKQTEEEETRRQEFHRMKEELKQKHIQDLEFKRNERKQNLARQFSEGKRNFSKVKKDVPLYLKIEERYKREILLPQIDEKQATLTNKKLMAQTIPVSELMEHARKHAQIQSSTEEKRKRALKEQSIESRLYLSSLPKSQFRLAVLQDQKAKTQYENESRNWKKQLLNKQKHYSQIVKEMFEPTVDKAKREEMELLKPSKSPQLPAVKSKSAGSDIVVKKRVWKKNLMIPEPVPKREPVFIDYLAERRSLREKGEISLKLDWARELEKPGSEEAKKAKVRAIARDIERKALEHEAKIGNFRANNRKNILDASHMTDLLVDSIKAKLAILESPELVNKLNGEKVSF